MSVKTRLTDLAALGGPPQFPEAVHVGRPNIGDRQRFLDRLNDILDRRWLTNNGPYVHEFERRIAAYLGVSHCVAVCNATIGLEIAIRALGMRGQVIVPSLTFVATAHALQWQEIQPVFCDVDPETLTLDPARVEELITPETSGVIGVHLWGRTCSAERLAELARRHGLKLLYDAAHAFGCTHRGQLVGAFGDAEVFSFHATKFMNSFEGGAIVTNNGELADKMRLMKNFGFAGYDEVIHVGTNGKMSEVAAAMGLTSLESIDELIATNRSHYLQYACELADLPGVRLLPYDEREKSNYQYIVAVVDEEQTGISRDDLMQVCWAENILARRYFYPGCHRMEPYRTLNPEAGLGLPVTESLLDRVLTLPTGTALQREDVRRICVLLRFVLQRGRDVSRALAERHDECAGRPRDHLNRAAIQDLKLELAR